MNDALFVSCARGVEGVLLEELQSLGAQALKERPGGVAGCADRAAAYRICLWSRLASRVLRPIARFPVDSAEALYEQARALPWPDWFEVTRSFAVEVAGRSTALPHTHFAALKLKDAVADAFRARCGARPNVSLDHPELTLHLYLHDGEATLSLDLAGAPLHRRGYRPDAAEAPLKETLAAALLVKAGWPALAAQGAPFCDPFCGSGTLVIEAAWMAADHAPQRLRPRFGFEALRDHDPALLNTLRAEAEERAQAGLARLPELFGSDRDARALELARRNARRAGLDGRIHWQEADALRLTPPGPRAGLIVCNPPYGERLGAEAELIPLYSLLGAHWAAHWGGWRAALFTGRPDLAQRLGLRAQRLHSLYNGPLPCKLLHFAIPPAPTPNPPTGTRPETASPSESAEGQDFANRLQKNLRHLGKWAARTGVTNYRVYDADLPDYALAIDLYAAPELHALVQEYAPPKSIDPARAEKRLRLALHHLREQLDLPPERLHYKQRAPQKGAQQYQRQGASQRLHVVEEHGVRLAVNFTDYLDTGLFLDHRPLRLQLQREARGKRFLNLFCYTGAATAHAAVGGAVSSVSVDLSNTYLDWAVHNLALNGLPLPEPERRSSERNPHRFFRADCLEWLAEQAAKTRPPQFDLIFLDPPTFSNSKKMTGSFDVQRDHPRLIEHALELLAPGGTLYFSCNRRGFKLDPALARLAQITDITRSTLDEDFKRPPPAHRAWRLRHPGA